MSVSSMPMYEYDEGRRDGPAHNGEDVFDSLYEDGAWDTLILRGECMTLLGFSPGAVHRAQDDGSELLMQGGMVITSSCPGGKYSITAGGGA